jgi:hypothetical protein
LICFVELASINDLARLACAFEHIPLPIYHITLNDNSILAVESEYINNQLVYYYVKYHSVNEFLAYKIIGYKEDIRLTQNAIDPTYSYAPIISIKEWPKELIDKDYNKCRKIVLKDLNSLAKLCSYKSLINDSPLYIIYSSSLLGVFLSSNDNTFFYCIKEKPEANFIRYNISTLQVMFTNKVDEHGYIYTKIITLNGKHKLIE